MEELQRHCGSRKGYRAHLTKLIASANELMITDIESSRKENAKTITALDSLLGQLNQKEALLVYHFRTHIWTDSQVVLYWLQGGKKLKPFVEHRITEIKQFTVMSKATWHYCPTADNPADMITRGTIVQKLATSSLWNKGPPWLTNDKNWPQWSPSTSCHLHVAAVTSEEFVPSPPRSLQQPRTISLHNIIDLANYNTLGKLL